MSQQGWIKIHRQIRECWLWDDKPFDRTHAWIDLLLKANHSDKKVALGTELIEVKRGSFITSELKLMDEWGWSKTKLRNFLKLLKEDGMIEIITDRKKTTINIVNYSVYQESENHEKTTEEPQEDHAKTNKRPIKDTNKNEKNEKNEKENIYSENEELNQAILDFIQMRKSTKKPMTDRAVTLMLGKLNQLSANEKTQIEILNQSIMNSWQGIFALKGNATQQRLPNGIKEIPPNPKRREDM